MLLALKDNIAHRCWLSLLLDAMACPGSAVVAQMEDRGSEITTKVKTFELISGMEVVNCRMEKIAVRRKLAWNSQVS